MDIIGKGKIVTSVKPIVVCMFSIRY